MSNLYADEDIRRMSYVGWGHVMLNQDKLVKSGFYYYGGLDIVRCFSCDLKLHSWKESDVPDLEHMKYSPSCSFIIGKLCQEGTNLLPGAVLMTLLEQKVLRQRIDRLERWVTTPVWGCDEIDLAPYHSGPEEVTDHWVETESGSESPSSVSTSSVG